MISSLLIIFIYRYVCITFLYKLRIKILETLNKIRFLKAGLMFRHKNRLHKIILR